MAKWVRSGVLDNGLNDIKTVAVKMYLISAYTAGDTYAVVIASALNSAGVTMASADYTLATAGSNRTLTTASGKTGTATSTIAAAAGNLHIAFTDGIGSVVWVTDETSEQAITSGNTINFPAPVYTSQQPV